MEIEAFSCMNLQDANAMKLILPTRVNLSAWTLSPTRQLSQGPSEPLSLTEQPNPHLNPCIPLSLLFSFDRAHLRNELHSLLAIELLHSINLNRYEDQKQKMIDVERQDS